MRTIVLLVIKMAEEKAEDGVREEITVIWNRRTRDLWINRRGMRIAVIWGVTNLEKVRGSDTRGVRIYSEGEQIGLIWDVVDIQEIIREKF